MSPKKKESSLAARICGMIVVCIVFIIAIWIGFSAQQMGADFIMYFAFAMAALCFIFCVAIGLGKVKPSTYLGPFGLQT